jgi:hypothetical protein
LLYNLTQIHRKLSKQGKGTVNKRILSFILAGLMVGLVSTTVVAEDTPEQQVQQIMAAMADGVTASGIEAAVQANQELAADIIIAAAKAVNAADRPGIIAAGLGALPAEQAAAVAKAVYAALPAEMQEDVITGAITAGLDPGPIGEAAAAGRPANPGNANANNAGGNAGGEGGNAGATGGSGTGAGTGASSRSRGGSGRGRIFVSPS